MDYRVDFNSIPWESPLPGMRAKIFKQGSRRLRLVEYSREMEPHWCENGHCGLVLEGRFKIEFDHGVQVFNPGDGVFIPSGREHRHMGRVLTDKVKVVFVEDA
jgi:ethanolamine utilization protein EutQ (cupin superfamily)